MPLSNLQGILPVHLNPGNDGALRIAGEDLHRFFACLASRGVRLDDPAVVADMLTTRLV